MLGLLLLVLQWPTVGDTVWLERNVMLPAGVSVRPRPLPASPLLDPLAPPRVVVRERTAVLQYPVVVWRPGRHTIEIPGPILVRPDGWSDTLPSAAARIEVASVLPEGPRDSLPPRALEAPIGRRTRSPIPAVVLLGIAAVALVPVHAWWRRRGPEPPAPAGGGRALGAAQLDAWLEAGEHRAALEGWSTLIRAVSGEPEGRDLLLGRLDQARYGQADQASLEALLTAARAWLARAGGGNA